MNQIIKHNVSKLGYGFIPEAYLPAGKNEYHFRFQQNPATDYRALTKQEITILKSNGNRSNNWEDVLVRDGIDIHLIEACNFFGLVRIGKLEPYFLEFSEVRFPVGLYNSQIVSCDIGDNVSINNVKFLGHYIIEQDVIMANINEMCCTSHSKFGNGILKDGEPEDVRIWLEICNENGGRKVMPFDGMLPGDAWLWSKFRGDDTLMHCFKTFTEQRFSNQHGYYGTVGERTVIKNCHIIKDVKIGTDAYIKGANKLKNLTINSTAHAKSQIGEGCEMVNGIMGIGSRAFYGVKAVRFYLAPFSQLKYGARLINSYLGENATVSCCEVLNSLIFPAHEQHHNNSFLCAALLMGQSNMAAGATIGSNHNSRGADGEIQAGRGFWPGLCVSLKHNSRFVSFTMIAKGNYPAELDIPLPFSLISNEEHSNKLVVMPAFWFLYDMYAIVRNENKFADRDKRIDRQQENEYDFLAPDTVNEIIKAIELLQVFTGKAFFIANQLTGSNNDFIEKGKSLLENKSPMVATLNILASGFENSKREVQINKTQAAYDAYKKMLLYYAGKQLVHFIQNNPIENAKALAQKILPQTAMSHWVNVGGQLVAKENLHTLLEKIKSGGIQSWDEVHQFYLDYAPIYQQQKLSLAFQILTQKYETEIAHFTNELLVQIFKELKTIRQWIFDGVYTSKEKDYKNPFRNMVYDSPMEMENVVGAFEKNSFILQQQQALTNFYQLMDEWIERFSK